MRLLSIDTTTVSGSIALSWDERLAAQEQQGVQGTHSERLIASIDHLLHLAGWAASDLEGIAVALGPGSFTGLRIGLATAKGLALALACPLAGASSLASLAQNGRGFAGTVVPLIDAKRGELYAAAWEVDVDGAMNSRLEELVAPPLAVAGLLQEIEGPLLLVGDGALVAADLLLPELGRRAHLAAGSVLRPQAVNLAMLTCERLRSGKGDDLAALAPNYIRISDAEIGFLGMHGKKGRKDKTKAS